jgi:threonine/homoserine/homoserine lactone efflux protein
MSFDTWLLYTAAAWVVILIPGPLSLLMIGNSLNYGVRRSWPGVLGGVSASICLLCASALGLGALLLTSERLFGMLKVAGALYLFWLAWQSWRASRQSRQADEVPDVLPVRHVGAMYWRAFGLGASNPKDILFFAAFLPQFLDPQRSFTLQLLTMVVTWATLDLGCKLFYGFSARGAARFLRSGKGQVWFNRLSAGLFGCAGGISLISR